MLGSYAGHKHVVAMNLAVLKSLRGFIRFLLAFTFLCHPPPQYAGVFGTSDLNNLMEESVKMAKFNHSNVMKLIGVCIDKGASPYIVMPYMAYGSLLSYLKKKRAELTLVNDDNIDLVKNLQCDPRYVCTARILTGYSHSVQATVNVSANFKGDVILGSSAVCTQGPRCKELHVRCLSGSYV